MKEETKSKLNALMDEYDEKLKKKKKTQEEIELEENAFIDEFYRLRRKVMRPIIDEIGDYIKEHGHDYKVKEEKLIDDYSTKKDAKITMMVFPSGIDRSAYTVSNISFTANKKEKDIYVSSKVIERNKSGTAEDRGVYNTNQINGDLVEKEIFNFLKAIFSWDKGSDE